MESNEYAGVAQEWGNLFFRELYNSFQVLGRKKSRENKSFSLKNGSGHKAQGKTENRNLTRKTELHILKSLIINKLSTLHNGTPQDS
ncbi:hypothetical protein ACFL6W_08555 [Thermodesulfobacteriota bacterium]